MRLLKSNLLTDGKLFNDGRPVDLIQIEKEEDFDALWNNIVNTGYYNASYFDSHIDYKEDEVKFDSLFLASILKFLGPKSLLELGCGRGDVLFLLGLDKTIEVRGIEFSQDVLKKLWPLLIDKVDFGDILEVSNKYDSQKITFDTICAFDLWEHIHPQKLHDYIDSVVALARKDSLFFFNIPAVGEDKVFGEIFPLELEENRKKFNQRVPFDYLNAESLNPAIPANGHLIWAHSEWWQKQFEQHGLVRTEELERNIHTYFDEHLFYARKSFYVFHLNTPEARYRVKKLTKKNLTLYRKWKLLVGLQESIARFMENRGSSFIDIGELKLTINHAEFYMIQELKKRIKKWTDKFQSRAKTGVDDQPMPSFLEKLAFKCLDVYIRISRKRRYLVKPPCPAFLGRGPTNHKNRTGQG
jgi:cyclopropane fatty-acyl-phospholipid synthase-like methyltransferase